MLVLYMLKRCEVPLSKSQIYDFILEKEYTNYMTLQEAFSELASTDLISEKTMANRTYLEITKEGAQTLEFFGNRINPSIRQEIDEYLKDNSMKLRNESAVLGDYKKTAENEYTVQLMVKENGSSIVDINLPVPTEEMAQAMIDNWQKNSQDIYQYVFSRLMEN
ncbi:DUF4364 family protein [Butyrivibrio sp. CB08]|uniref:DUF4364 family protein n=1 Tax=Butyrivibrio sp. CB08 TaxID=2364879 RepID=UPI00210F742A|nr:DUF4364 family protein [Butyrivibrio sp. CB08]